jgi:arginyl-tRNA synthetase
MQLVRLMQGDTEVRMSKRAGEFVTMDELLEEVGVDAARWFFLERGANTHMDFDLDLAKEKSEKNPVYYVQYAHTRMASILQKSTVTASPLKAFKNKAERELALKILRYPEILADTARDYGVQRLTSYAYELAQTFSAFYRDVKVIGSEREAELLYLVLKTKETLADALEILGISRPEKM